MNVELEAIIRNAIAQAEISHEFYLQMAELATVKENKETFQLLAKVEQEHNKVLQSIIAPQEGEQTGEAQDVAWIEEESLRRLGMMEPKVGATMHSGGTFIDNISALSPTESILFAMMREEGSYKLYENLAARQPQGKPRTVLEKISQLKLGLKEKLEYLYYNAKFVEVW